MLGKKKGKEEWGKGKGLEGAREKLELHSESRAKVPQLAAVRIAGWLGALTLGVWSHASATRTAANCGTSPCNGYEIDL